MILLRGKMAEPAALIKRHSSVESSSACGNMVHGRLLSSRLVRLWLFNGSKVQRGVSLVDRLGAHHHRRNKTQDTAAYSFSLFANRKVVLCQEAQKMVQPPVATTQDEWTNTNSNQAH